MIGKSGDNTVDETIELRAIAKLLFGGYFAAILCGMVYYWPVQSAAVEVIRILVTGLLLYASCLPLVLASTGIRNAVWRRLDLRPGKQMTVGAGIFILLILLIVAAKAFGIGQIIHMTD